MKVIFGVLVFAWAGFGGLYGQDVPPPDKTAAEETNDPFMTPEDPPVILNVQAQVEYIEMAHEDLTRLLMENKQTTADATALRMKVQGMVDTDKAKLLDTQMTTGRSGQKTSSESRDEFIYPTEYEPPATNVKKAAEKAALSSFPVGPATPSAFETRNLGSSFECEPTVHFDGSVDLRILTGIRWHTGDKVWSEAKDDLGNISKTLMPEIYALDISTTLACIGGQYSLLGVVSPKDANGRMDTERKVMVFVKCDVLPVKP